MRKTEDFLEQLRTQTQVRMGFDGSLVEQGSPEWHRMRLGVITASNAKALISAGTRAPFPKDVPIHTEGRGRNTVTFDGKTLTGTKTECTDFVRDLLPPVPSQARHQYLLKLVSEIMTGQPKDQGSFKQTEWGKEHEEEARDIFSNYVGTPINDVPFIYGDDSMRYGCSPDGIADEHSGLELKCPYNTEVFADFMLFGNINEDYIEQCQFSMFVTGMPYWHFANFDKRVLVDRKIHAITIERDEARMETFEDAVGQMIYDMDRALFKVGLLFGDQWKRPVQACEPAEEDQAAHEEEQEAV